VAASVFPRFLGDDGIAIGRFLLLLSGAKEKQRIPAVIARCPSQERNGGRSEGGWADSRSRKGEMNPQLNKNNLAVNLKEMKSSGGCRPNNKGRGGC